MRVYVHPLTAPPPDPPHPTHPHTASLKVPAAMQRLIYQGKVLKEEDKDIASFGGASVRVALPCVVHCTDTSFPFPFE